MELVTLSKSAKQAHHLPGNYPPKENESRTLNFINMTIERYFELQDKLLCLENALQHYGMDKEAKEAHCIVDDLFVIINENDTNDVEKRCLKFLEKYKHIRDKFDSKD